MEYFPTGRPQSRVTHWAWGQGSFPHTSTSLSHSLGFGSLCLEERLQLELFSVTEASPLACAPVQVQQEVLLLSLPPCPHGDLGKHMCWPHWLEVKWTLWMPSEGRDAPSLSFPIWSSMG